MYNIPVSKKIPEFYHFTTVIKITKRTFGILLSLQNLRQTAKIADTGNPTNKTNLSGMNYRNNEFVAAMHNETLHGEKYQV